MEIFNLNQVTTITARGIHPCDGYIFADYYISEGFFKTKKVKYKDGKKRWSTTYRISVCWWETEEFLSEHPNYMVIDEKLYAKPKIVLHFSDSTSRTLYFVSNEEMYLELEKIKGMMTYTEALYNKEK